MVPRNAGPKNLERGPLWRHGAAMAALLRSEESEGVKILPGRLALPILSAVRCDQITSTEDVALWKEIRHVFKKDHLHFHKVSHTRTENQAFVR